MVSSVHPGQIESELDRIWHSLKKTSKMRGRLFNLIIYSKAGRQFEYLDKIARQVIRKFPSRMIFITYDDLCKDPALKIEVSVLTDDEGECEIACDMIEIKACTQNQPKIPFVVLANILPDLPIYLLHASTPTLENPLDKKLEVFADRIIFDSKEVSHLPAYATAVLKKKARTRVDIADLNWARMEGWRQLFASVFQSSIGLKDLRSAKTIKIYFNLKELDSLHKPHIQATYLQAWLASQLGWRLNAVSKEHLIYQSDGRPVHIYLYPEKMDSTDSGQILSVEIDADPDVHYEMRRHADFPQNVIVKTSSDHFCSIPLHFVLNQNPKQSLVKEICHKGTSVHYTNMLKLVANIKNESLCP